MLEVRPEMSRRPLVEIRIGEAPPLANNCKVKPSVAANPVTVSVSPACGAVPNRKLYQSTSFGLSMVRPVTLKLPSITPTVLAVRGSPLKLYALAGVSLRATPSVWSTRIGLPELIVTTSSPAPPSIQTVFCTVGPTVI